MLFQQWPLQAMQCKRSPATRSVDATVTVFTWGLWNQNVQVCQVCGMTMYMQCLCIHAMYTYCTLYWSRDF